MTMHDSTVCGILNVTIWCNQATLFAAALARATIYGCYVASSGIRTRNVGDGLLWVLVAMATVKRGSSLCEGCGTSNGNRALVCKGCGKLLSTKTKRAKPQPVTTYSSNVTRLLDAELKTEIATAISVRVRPQGPDYRCFATKGVDGTWKCTNKDCELVRQGRVRSMESGMNFLHSL